jgi:Spy/CpxP family protein refolding chaperone
MSKRIFIALGLVAVLAGAAIAQNAGPQGPGPRRGPGGPGGRGFAGDLGLRGIELTETQREQVRTIMERHQTGLQQAMTRLRDAHRGLAEATQADSLNEQTVRTQAAAVGSAMADEAILRARMRSEVLAILTAEQQQQLKQRAGQRREAGPRQRRPQ